ncbi:MAG TPA: UDP-3-O-(3-hydroxymyristoyl)glucosamine N-acyltransferase [Chitinophagales bacterium]|nr:UDP-3-O-(3-hydroxymyristoyl)glucosamine N-acyltransferase [Chitinophagales bacterium]
MRFTESYTLADIAQWLGVSYAGSGDAPVTGLNEIHKVEAGDITFVDFHKYYDAALNSAATFIIINKEVDCPAGKGLLFSDDPFRDFVKLAKRFRPAEHSLHPVADSAVVGEGTILYPGVYVGPHVQIGKNCIIHPNVVLYDHTIIGNNVIIHAGAVLGADAFYYKKRKEPQPFFDKLYSCGRVVVEDDVEIGAACTIDKGVSGDTVIGKGSKLDNHIHIGHGVVLGERTLIAAQVGIGGKTVVGNDCIFWGQVGISKTLHIGDNVTVLAQSGVGNDLESGKSYFGSPAIEARKAWREMAKLKKLAEGS